jgi:parallel beta-helix repeat protein
VGSWDHNLYALNPDGTLKWNYTTGDFVFSSPAIDADGTIYVGSGDNSLYAINPDGTLNWSYMAYGPIYSSPAIGENGTIYFGSYDDDLYAVGEAHPQVITVPDDYPTIQASINAANAGDTVFVRAGIYYENVIVNKSLTILGENKDTTFVVGSPGSVVFRIESDNVFVSGFTMQDGNTGVAQSARNGTIKDSIITNSTDQGIYLSGIRNTASGNLIVNCGTAMLVYGNNQTISANNIANNGAGISLLGSSGSSIIGNKFINNGLSVIDSYQNSVENNTVNGRPLVYLEGVSNHTVDDAGQVILVKCENITVEGLNLSRTDVGIELWETNNSTIAGDDVTTNKLDGIDLYISSNNSISGNNVTNNGYDGIMLAFSSFTTILGNNITANSGDGLYLFFGSTYNSIIGNNIANNGYGISLIGYCSNNKIFHNNFINNTMQVVSTGSANVWDDGYPSGGNYWSDYNGTDIRSGQYQNETGSDGIGDKPYVIDANNKDRYPRGVFMPAGDLNGDGIVNILDAVLAASAFGSSPGHPNWNSLADLNNDGIIDIFDLIILASNFGKTTP